MSPGSAPGVLAPYPVVPVVVIDDDARADDLGAALVAGGIPVAEVTLRTRAAVGAMRRLAARGDLLVGAGTVLTADQVDEAHDAGARFVVSPGLSVAVVERCRALELPVVPGTATPTDIIRALDLGVDTVKFFPAEASGGLGMIGALAAAFPQVGFVATGGITAASAPTYLAHPAVVAVGGSWMLPAAAMAAGHWDEVVDLCAATVAALSPAAGAVADGRAGGAAPHP